MKTLFKINLLIALLLFAGCSKEPSLTSLSIQPASVEMKVGDSFQLEVKAEPAGIDADMEWISGNPSVVTVDNGKLTALAAGTSKVLLLSGTMKAECMVAVTDAEESTGLNSLTITSGDLEMLVGDSKKLAVEWEPSDYQAEIVWVSDDQKVVSVSQDGFIEALAVGETTIKAICGEIRDEITVKVKEPVLERIVLSYEKMVLDRGAEYQLVAYVTPESFASELKWKSSDYNIASVTEEGIVTAKQAGQAEITAYIGDMKAVCQVTVEDLDIFIFLTRNHVSLHPGEGYQLELTVDPVDALEKYGVQWRSDDESIATVSDEGKVEAVAPGFTRVHASVAGKESSCVIGVLDERIKPEWEKYELFDVEGYGKGLVIKKDQHFITVMAFEFSSQKWAEDASVVVGNGETAYFEKDGVRLTEAIGRAAEKNPGNFPAYDWVKSFGKMWYLPSPEELNEFCDYYGRKEIDEVLTSLEKDILPETVWSSAETRRSPFVDAGYWSERYVVESSKTLTNGCIALMKVLYK